MIEGQPVAHRREILDGAAAIVRGALRAGCTFFAGYPITPASSILMQMMRELPRAGGVAIQGEDEIASIGMCIGAVTAGARAMTATSGPGLSLYSENIGLAVMGEVPLVIVDVQRLGPATGGATTVGQGDVQFVRWGTSGGYPIVALAPSSVPECYTLTMQAFDLAERFRCPVFLVADKELALTANTIDEDELVDVPVRPRATVPRYGDGILRFTGSSHDERGFLSKDPAVVGALNRHLAEKIAGHADEVALVAHDPQPGARTLLVSYGITAGAMRAAAARARAQGHPVSALTVKTLWPVPEAALEEAAAGMDRVIVAELNLGDYRREVERVVGRRGVVTGVHRVDGELITPAELLSAIDRGLA